MGGPVQTYCLRWNNHKSNLVEILEALIKKESYVDCTIYVDDQIQFRAHRVVLAANSIFFQNIFQDVPMDHCSILFPGVKEFEMRALIEYMYTGEVNVTQSQIPHIMKIAAQLEVKGLFDLTDYKDRMEKIDGKLSDRSNNFMNSQKYFQRLYSHQHEHQQQQQQQQNQQHQQQQQHINVQQPQQNIHQHHQHQSQQQQQQQQQQSNHNLHSNRGIGSGSHYQNPLHHTQQHEHLSHTSSTTTSTTSSLNNNNNHHTTITNKQHHYNRQISSPPPIISTSSNALSTSAQSSTTSPPLHYPNIEFPYSYARPSSPLHEIPEHMEPTAAWPIIGARLPTIHNRSPSPIHTQQQQQLQPSLPPRSSSSHRRSSVLSHNQLPLLPLSLQHQTQSQSNSPRIASISGNNNNNDNSSATAAPSSAITSTSSQIMSAMQLYRAKTAPYSSPSPPPGSNPITSPPATSSGQHSPPQPPQTLTLQSQQPPSSSLPPSPSPQTQQQKKQLRIQSPPIISQHTSNLLSSVYEYGADNNPLKRKKMQSMLHDTPILRNVLAKAIVTDSSHQQQQQQQLSVPLVSPSIKENDRMDYSISSVSSQILHPSANGNEFIERKIKYEGRQSPGTDKSFDEDSIETVHPFTNDNRLTGYTQQQQQQQPSPPISHHHQHASASSSSTYQQQHNVNQHSSTSQSQSSNQKPEWKRYKQYTRNDISKAIECVRSGMSALQASRKYGVPSRTLYDKVKKLGITTGRPMNRTMKRSPNNSTNNNSNSNVANYPYCIPGASSSNASPYNRDNNSHPHHHDNNNNNNNSSSTSASQLRHSQHLHQQQQQQQQHLQQFQLGQQSTLDRNDRERAHRDRDRERDRGGSNKSIPSQFIDATFLQHALEGKNSGDAFHAMAAMAAVAAVNGGTTPPNTITTPTHSPNSPNNMLLKYVKRRSCSISSDKTIEHESMAKRYRRPPMDDDDDDDNERIHNTSNDVDMVAEDADAGDIIDHGDHHDDDHVVDDDDYDDDREDNHHNNGDDRIEHVENEPHSMKVEDLNQVEDLSMGKKDLINERTTQISPLAIQMSPPPQPQRSSKSSTSPTSSCSEFGGNNPEEYRRRKDRRHLHYRSKYRSQQEEEAAEEEEEVVVVEKSAGNEFEEPHERSHHRLIIDNHRDDTNDAENHGNHKSDNVVETDNEGPLEDEQLNIATPMNKNNNSNDEITDEINDDHKMGHHDNIHEPSSKLAIVTNENDESENEIDFIESTDKHNRMKLSSPTSSAAGSLPTSPLPVQSQSQQLGVIVPPMIPTTKL